MHLRAAIEGVVIKWVKSIDDFLQVDSSCAFEREANPTPRFGKLTLGSCTNNV